MMRVLLLTLWCSVFAAAFAPQSQQQQQQQPQPPQWVTKKSGGVMRNMGRGHNNEPHRQDRAAFLRNAMSVILATAAAGSSLVTPALAGTTMNDSASTSFWVADVIKTLDMSLPSYNDISSYKASVENTKSLYVDPAKVDLGIPKSARKTPAMSSVLPSMGKDSAEKKKKKKNPYSSYNLNSDTSSYYF